MEIVSANGLTPETEKIFAKAQAIVSMYEAGNVIDGVLDDINVVAYLWDHASAYQTELARDIVMAQRTDTLSVVLPYSIMSHAYDSVTYREVLCETLTKTTRDIVKEQVEGHEHEIPFELVTFMQENEIRL